MGAGGHGRELLATIDAVNAVDPTWTVLGAVDDVAHRPERLERLGAVLLGDVAWLDQHPSTYALGIGTSGVRVRLDERLSAARHGARDGGAPGRHGSAPTSDWGPVW